MDFVDYPSFPILARPDCSPTSDVFSYQDVMDRAYVADSYATSPDHSLAGFSDQHAYFDRPISSVEPSRSLVGFPISTPPEVHREAQLKVPFNPAFNQSTFSHAEQFPPSFSFNNTATNPIDFNLSPFSPHSSTPSLCGDAPQSARALSSPSPSPPPAVKRESADDDFVPNDSKPPQRKRGRPRLDRTTSSTSTSTASSTKSPRTHRLPHNQVERKYREGLNAELDRLRRAVPTLPQCDSGSLASQPRPSKAMILAGAIDYIKRLEKERDAFQLEADQLRMGSTTTAGEPQWEAQ